MIFPRLLLFFLLNSTSSKHSNAPSESSRSRVDGDVEWERSWDEVFNYLQLLEFLLRSRFLRCGHLLDVRLDVLMTMREKKTPRNSLTVLLIRKFLLVNWLVGLIYRTKSIPCDAFKSFAIFGQAHQTRKNTFHDFSAKAFHTNFFFRSRNSFFFFCWFLFRTKIIELLDNKSLRLRILTINSLIWLMFKQ